MNQSTIDVEKLIDAIEAHPTLYHVAHPDYKNPLKKKDAWESVAHKVGDDPSACTKRWTTLRDYYVRERRRMDSPSESNASNKRPWYLMGRMSFLEDAIGPIRRRRLVQQKAERETIKPIAMTPCIPNEYFATPHHSCGSLFFNDQFVYRVRCNNCDEFVSLYHFRAHHLAHLNDDSKDLPKDDGETGSSEQEDDDEITTKPEIPWPTEMLFFPEKEAEEINVTTIDLFHNRDSDEMNHFGFEKVSIKSECEELEPDQIYEIKNTSQNRTNENLESAGNSFRETSSSSKDMTFGSNENDDVQDYHSDISELGRTRKKCDRNRLDFDDDHEAYNHPRFKCIICNKNCRDQRGLRRHLNSHKSPPEKPKPIQKFKCNECNEEFKDEHRFKLHGFKHTGYVCKICNNNRKYSSYTALKTHQRTHGEKKHKCQECDAKFCSVFELRFHSTKHTGLRKMMCELCGKPCKDRWHLEQHLLRHSGERPVACPNCDKRFFNTMALKNHSSVHSNERPYKCDVCGSGFKRKWNLRVHRRGHSSEPLTVQCKVCTKMFENEAGLLSHMSIHDTVYGLCYPASGTILGNQSPK